MHSRFLMLAFVIALGSRFVFSGNETPAISSQPTPQKPTSKIIGADKKVTEKGSTEKSKPAARQDRSRGRFGSGSKGVVVEDRRSSAAARAKGEINFDDLKFEIEKDQPFVKSMLNDDLHALDGKQVKLRGYILPASVYKDRGIDRFVLVRDNQECCFGPGAALFDAVMVEMEPDKTADFVTRPVTVEGKFEIDLKSYQYPPGLGPRGATHLAIFRIRGVKVQ